MFKVVIFFQIFFIFATALEEDGIFPFWDIQSSVRNLKKPLRSPSNPDGWGEQIQVKWLPQKLDHFNHSDERVFMQRYLYNEEHFQPGGPIFIFVGGEWPVDLVPMDRFLDEGTFYEIAAENNGLLLYPEHRYYGKTQPFSVATADTFKYLSVEQALEDLSEFIHYIKSTNETLSTSKVILSGASYSALLATYFRLKYPHVADGSWASSAVANIQVETGSYREVAGEAYRKYGSQQCYDAIDAGYTRIEEMLDAGDVEPLEQIFKLCNKIDLNNELDVEHFVNIITSMLASTVAASDAARMKALCDAILSDDDPVVGISKVTDQFFQGPCLRTTYQSYLNYFDHANDMTHPSSQGARQWFYQTCTQFGTYQTSISPNQPFGRKTTAEPYFSFCKDIYGFDHFDRKTLEANTRRMRLMYGGFNSTFTRVFTTQGEIDPWRGAGLQSDLNPESPVMVIEGASHCNDLYLWFEPIESIQQAREKIKSLVKEWIK